MKQVGVYEAKTHLPRLLSEVERGDSVTITRHGRPIARLVPMDGPRKDVAEVIAAIEAFPKGRLLKGETIKEFIEEGRRF